METGKLVVLGSINADHILNIEQFPRPGETVIGQQYNVAFGGKGANQAVAAGRSGADIAFIACVGDDDIGERVRQQLTADKIDTQPIEAIKGATTGVALIFVNSDGENVIGINAGANSAVTPEYLRRYQQQVIDADALLMQLESPLDTVIAAAKLAKQHQTQVILNPAPARKLPDELLTLVDMITPNETEAERLTGIHIEQDDDAAKAAQILHDKGITTVIITLGSRGVWLSEQGKGKLVAGFKVNAVDTIAAGDTFNGALLTALLEGQSMDVAVRFAHAAAAIAVTRPGAQPSIPWRAEIDSFLQERV
ncbi:ribokinase [Yersinia pseudotuberculosis]|uniref:Ribokinase n=6 Tax=Yersinia pseudotuberculosis complex TaxID=1649845 RepID=A0A0H3B7Z4_YERPY|nr:ribokinase [Yersinia pseudotuberculosis]AJJ58702.1 ribokinase [Yersinia pseudotuberculosis YPIII]AYW86117.1 ribokinase [Yersinia pseudotuberculosis]AYX00756.1 ribokinase [Yersinia pseudotuberculosis]AZA32319.1 ribokinase [Yersinia pseudotuberculosis]MBK1422809.1 ribokinase [Yersinia pseudotuberculosis]